MQHEITTQKELRRRFWQDNPQADRKNITDYTGKGKMHTTDTRCLWCDYVDSMCRQQVQAATGLSRSSIYLLISKGEFPAPIALTGRAVAWPSDAVQTWIDSRIDAIKS